MSAGISAIPRSRWLLPALLAALLARLWIMPMGSSFWVDEMVTAFVVHHGPRDASLAVAPQVAQSVYYVLPWAAERLFGLSEWAYRLPSLLAMGLSLWLIARIARRLLHAEAAWLVVFCCLLYRPFDYEAADARPYALGTLLVSAAVWFLIRWLDDGRWRDALLFAAAAALVCLVHLIFWPMYLVFALVAAVRLWRGDTPASRRQALAAGAIVAPALAMVFLPAVSLLRQAGAHVIVGPPESRDLSGALKLVHVTLACAAAAIAARWKGWTAPVPAVQGLLLIAAWWLIDPLSLFGFSYLSGSSVFIARYYAVALPGAALATAAGVALFLPQAKWRPMLVMVGAAILLVNGDWSRAWPPHHNSDWRGAARFLSQLPVSAATPLICPSPFVEARPPVWRTDYPIDSFLYAHLLVYPVRGTIYPFPFERSPEAERLVEPLWKSTFAAAPTVILFGGAGQVASWRDWFRVRAQTWSDRVLGQFGDVWVVEFDAPR